MPFTHHLPWLFYYCTIWRIIQIIRLLIVYFSPVFCQFLLLSYKYSPRNSVIDHCPCIDLFLVEWKVILNPCQTSCKVTVAKLMSLRRGQDDKWLWTEQEGKYNIILSEMTGKAIITSATVKFWSFTRQEYSRATRHKNNGREMR